MFTLLCAAVVLLSVSSQDDTGFSVIGGIFGQAQPLPTPTSNLKTTLAPIIPLSNGPLALNPPKSDLQLIDTTGDNSKGLPLGTQSPRTSCTFYVNTDDVYEPKNDSFSYPWAIVSQALKGTLAEQALGALQNVKLRNVIGNDEDNFNSGQSNFPTNLGFDSGGSPFHNNAFNFGPSYQSFPGNPGNVNKDNTGLDHLLGGIGQHDKTFSLKSPEAPSSVNRNFQQIFPRSTDARFSPFGNQRVGSSQPSGGSTSPFGFYGVKDLTPLSSGSSVFSNDNSNQNRQGKPFDPFDIGSRFPIPRTARRKRQARSNHIRSACQSELMLLREYMNYGDRCYVINPELQQHMFVQCSNEACSGFNLPQGSSRCIPEVRGVSLWSYCENGPAAKTVSMDFIQLPIMCTCKVMTCA